MSDLISPDFLEQLKSLYPAQPLPLRNPWHFVAAVALSASNRPEAVPLVFLHALKDFDKNSGEGDGPDALTLVRKIKDAVFKSGILSGYPKAINALGALYEATPANLRDKEPLRNAHSSTQELERLGDDHFRNTYGETADQVKTLLDNIYPDLAFFSITFAYGYVYAFSKVLSPVETSFAMIAALVALDTPRQVEWHLQGAVRNGASVSEVRAVRQIAIDACRAVGVTWRHAIPDI